MTTISSFKSVMQGGGARGNQFTVELAFPAFVNGGIQAGQEAQFLCNAAQLPSSTIEPITVMYRGRPINFAGERTFQPWQITIYNDTNFNIRNALEQWSNGIQNNATTNGITNPLDYQVDMGVHQLDRTGAKIKTYRFKDAFPLEVGDIQLGYDQGNAVETFNVTFMYNFWVSDTTPAFV